MNSVLTPLRLGDPEQSSALRSVLGGGRRTLLSERASLTNQGGRVVWKLRSRGDQVVDADEKLTLSTLGGQSGIDLRTRTECPAGTFSYLRGQFSLAPAECEGGIRFSVQVGCDHAPGVRVIVSLYDDPAFANEIATVVRSLDNASGVETVELNIDSRPLAGREAPVFGIVQVSLPTHSGATINVGQLTAASIVENTDHRRLRVRFDAFGDETKASSRLRVWKFAELLREEGHDVSVGGKEIDVDVYFCQKDRRFGNLAAVRKANPNAVAIYDFDDNFFLEDGGVISEVLAFIGYVDVVTCGSEYLAQFVRPWHPNVYVLENPLDVASEYISRPARGELGRIGWFGSPEGLLELAKTDAQALATTLTKGGDIEFDLQTVDHELAKFDLLLFPVEETTWNLAKNANRMMKALALGVPVLISPTPEQKRIAELVGLPQECLVPSFNEWKEGIDRARSRFGELEQAALGARSILWTTHSTRAVLSSLFDHLFKTTRLGNALFKPARSSSPAFEKIAVLTVDGSDNTRFAATFNNSRVNWSDFYSVQAYSPTKVDNEIFHLRSEGIKVDTADYLSVFAAADRAIRDCQAEYLLVIPAGVALAYGFAEAIGRVVEGDPLVVLFATSEFHGPANAAAIGAHPLRDLLLNPMPSGPLLVKAAWAREQRILWQHTFELWPWVAAVKALAGGLPATMVEWPVAFQSIERVSLNVAQQYATWLGEHQPASARELPDLSKQWGRMLTDIVAGAASAIQADLPSIVAQLHAREHALRLRLASAEKELRKLKKPKPPAR